MKRIISLAATIIVVTSAQSVQAQVTVGVSGGLSRAKADVSDETAVGIPTNALNGLVAGLVAGYQLTPHLGLRFGAQYAEGGTLITPPGSAGYDMDFGVSFLEFPLFVKVAGGGAVSPYLLAGAVMGVKTDADLTAKLGSVRFSGDASPLVEKVSWALGLGVGVETPLVGGVMFSLEGQYLFGMNNFIRSGTIELSSGLFVEDADVPPGTEAKSRGFRFQVGLATPVG
jgi:opacity protein-like surface antigen